ncbi:replicative DNA helicase [Vibrio owensii]|uniref:replicative DNA helicase n=1 Tax=Vibrio owensii TaxID=696485 RepID=UPI003CC6334D
MQPIYSLDAEASVLGGLFEHEHLFDDIQSFLKPKDFYSSEYRKIFSAIVAIKRSNRTIDGVNVKQQLINEPEFEDIDETLAFLPEPSYEQCIQHAEIIKDYSAKRALLSGSKGLQEFISENPNVSKDEIISYVHKNINSPIEDESSQESTVSSYADLLPKTLQKIRDRAQSGSDITGLSTGIDELDKLTSGLQRTDLIIVAARPSMGKTTFSSNVVDGLLAKGMRAMIFTVEMPGEDLQMRTIASIARVNQTNIRKGQLTELETAKLARAVEMLDSFDAVIDEDGGLDIHKLRARALKAHKEKPLDIIMIDYLQLMKVEDPNNKTAGYGEITRGLKLLAKELNVPVILLSQLNRSLEQRADKRPINSDLRDSGAIEQDADLILFVYRDEVYNPDTVDKGIGEIIIGKQRNGPLGTARTRFVGAESRFDNLVSNEDVESMAQSQPVGVEEAEIDVNSPDSPI